VTLAGFTPSALAGAQDVGHRFAIAPPALVEARALQQRIDRKFVLAAADLPRLLDGLEHEYVRLDAGGEAWARYHSVYFDTPERGLFHAHRRGVLPRHKVRIRQHVDRGLAFLEVKHKGRSGRTRKLRLDLSCHQRELGEREQRFVREHVPLDSAALVPSVSSLFRRLTLVACAAEERVTIDGNLGFVAGPHMEDLRHVVIVEVKQARSGDRSRMVSALRAVRARNVGISKYCVGTMMLTPTRANVFLPALKALQRVSA
jgi:hypothetical protein